ncbi:X-ray repair cross-complementing protein 6 [Andrena cerasifolii]|uniref:X-ray repair cross-complementing protein 6 n=1 Tax=Andrena cerasifolii TaxID=2819439 RepID=UPI0040382E0D
MASFDEEFDSDDDFEDDPKELYGIRDGILFVIDATPPMFENDPKEGVPYFLQCIRHYKEILKQKLGWNRTDWMGLTLFGTDKWDTDSETKHVLTLQKISLISVDNLKEIIKIDTGSKWKYYRGIASSTAYPLHDVLWHAARAFSAIEITMPMRRVILFTCRDDPPLTHNEKHKIRIQVASYGDIELQLCVIGLGESWQHDLFYQDLEMLSEKIDTIDYQRTSLQDSVKQIKLPSRNMAKLPWRLGGNIIIDVSIRNLSVKTQYLKKEYISKETNAPLTSYTYLELADDDNNRNNGEDEENDHFPTPVLQTEIKKYLEFGGRKICFQPAEVRSLGTTRMPGIDLICIKPIFYQPLYHFGAPYFIIPSKSNRTDNKLVFGGLLNKCDSRNLMIVCAVTLRKRSAPNLYTMIPNPKHGGFYLYKMSFKENIRNLSIYYPEHIYDDNENKPPSDPNGIELLEKIIQKIQVQYDPELFSNPKLQVQLQTVETLALDLEQGELPPDPTILLTDQMRNRVEDLLKKYDEIFNEEVECTNDAPLKKRVKKVTEATIESVAFDDDEKIRKIVAQGKLASCTVLQLKEMLKTLGLKTTGKKNDLLDRIVEYCT